MNLDKNKSHLDNFHLQIVSKYFNHDMDLNNLIKIHTSLNEYYFQYTLNISYKYILPTSQIKELIKKLKIKFPNLKEIVLSFYSHNGNIDITWFEEYVLQNYFNFLKYSKNIKIKIKFDFKILTMFYFIDGKDIRNINLHLYILHEFLKQNIIISPIYLIFDTKFINIQLFVKTCYELFDKYKFIKNNHSYLNFIIDIGYSFENNKWGIIDNMYKNINGFYYSIYPHKLYFNNMNMCLSNPYTQNILKDEVYLYFIKDFPYIYQILKLRERLKNKYINKFENEDITNDEIEDIENNTKIQNTKNNERLLNNVIHEKRINKIYNIVFNSDIQFDNYEFENMDDENNTHISYFMKYYKYYKSSITINKDLKLYKTYDDEYVFNISDNAEYRKLKYKSYYYEYIINDIKNYFKINNI